MFRRRSYSPPGTVETYAAAGPSALRVLTYTATAAEEHVLSVEVGADAPELPEISPAGIRWITVTGVHDGALLRALGDLFGIHPLYLEDVQHTDQRPKIDAGDDHLFLVFRLGDQQVSVFASGRTVLLFLEHPSQHFNEVADRVRSGRGRIRAAGPDYLCYALLDAVVDSSLASMDAVQSRMEDLEEAIMDDPSGRSLAELHTLRSTVVAARRAVWPLREAVQSLLKAPPTYLGPETIPFLRDALDHVLALIDTVDSLSERARSMVQLHAAMVGAATNETMRVLTIIATIFIPLTFVAGIYGMNFQRMPELAWPWGYPTVVGVMFFIALGMVVFFKRRRWM